jgi:hypothetical protein
MNEYIKSTEPIAKRQRSNCNAKLYVTDGVTTQVLPVPGIAGGKSRRRKSKRRKSTRRRKSRRH